MHDATNGCSNKADEWVPQHCPTHACPPTGGRLMPCCDRTPFGVPWWHRMTLDPTLVTCTGFGTERQESP